MAQEVGAKPAAGQQRGAPPATAVSGSPARSGRLAGEHPAATSGSCVHRAPGMCAARAGNGCWRPGFCRASAGLTGGLLKLDNFVLGLQDFVTRRKIGPPGPCDRPMPLPARVFSPTQRQPGRGMHFIEIPSPPHVYCALAAAVR